MLFRVLSAPWPLVMSLLSARAGGRAMQHTLCVFALVPSLWEYTWMSQSAFTGTYIDKKCPFTGNVSIRGRILNGEQQMPWLPSYTP